MVWPLTGRERELTQITAARADPGCAGVVLVADAGVGKSRLAREAQLAASDAHGEWVQATRSAATVPLAAFSWIVPDDTPADDVFEVMRHSAAALRARAGRKPAVLVVDDAHLLDQVSAALVLHLASTRSAFVIATVRAGEPAPDAIASLWKDAGAHRIELEPLPDDRVRALVETALEAPVQEAALRWVTDVAQGNALYVHELVSGAIDAGALVHENGFWRLHGTPPASRSLVELVTERLDALGAQQRTAVELLALGEPLAVDALSALTSEAALIDAEAAGLLTMRGSDLGLAHPLYGEVIRGQLPALRARLLRLKLADALAGESALRVARLRLDAGAPLEPALALTAGRDANLAGDPDLGAQLAELAGPGLDTAMVLAQAHVMRNRHADAESVLAAVEADASEHPAGRDYLRRRVWNLSWGLHDAPAATALLDRATPWADALFVERLRAALDPFMAPPGPVSEHLPDEAQGMLAAQSAVALVLAGRVDEAAARTRDFRPPVPLRHLGDSAMLATLSLVTLESGADWPAVEAYMGRTLREGVRANDHDAAGLAALTLGRLAHLRGRDKDTARWLAEAEIHLALHDSFGAFVTLEALAITLAGFETAQAKLAALQARLDGKPLLPTQVPHLRRAEAWVLQQRSPAEASRHLLEAAEASDSPTFAAGLAYEALRAGASAVPAPRARSPLIDAYAAHAAARAAHDASALLDAAEAFATIGADRYAVEAASEAAAAFVRAGRQDSARRAAARARELHVPDQHVELPVIDGLDTAAFELTTREQQVTKLVAQGLSNAEIADRLVLSVRTVETHVYRSLQKLGLNDRRELHGT